MVTKFKKGPTHRACTQGNVGERRRDEEIGKNVQEGMRQTKRFVCSDKIRLGVG